MLVRQRDREAYACAAANLHCNSIVLHVWLRARWRECLPGCHSVACMQQRTESAQLHGQGRCQAPVPAFAADTHIAVVFSVSKLLYRCGRKARIVQSQRGRAGLRREGLQGNCGLPDA